MPCSGAEGVRIVISPPQTPRANAICKRVVGTLRREVFDQLLVVNQAHLANVLDEYPNFERHRLLRGAHHRAPVDRMDHDRPAPDRAAAHHRGQRGMGRVLVARS